MACLWSKNGSGNGLLDVKEGLGNGLLVDKEGI